MKKVSVVWLVLIQWMLAYQWLEAGWGKWAEPGFMAGIGKSLAGFAAKTPYAWYANFLKSTAIPNATVFGNSIRSGELLVGAALLLAGIVLLTKKRLPPVATWLLIIACFGGALMNLNFYLAAGWSSPSTAGLNVMMGLIELIFGIYYLFNRKALAIK